MLGVVHAATRPVEERPLDVDPEHAGHAGVDRGLHGRDRARDRIEIIADQRRQETRRAETPVRGADRADRFEARGIIEQHTAAAVDLDVDEAGQQQLIAEIHADRAFAERRVRGTQRLDARPRQQQRLSAHDAAACQDPAVDQCGSHYRVLVILRRWAG